MGSERAAVEWVLATRGYIAADGSMLDQMARRVWEQWWLERESRQLDAGELVQRAFALDAAARPSVFGWPADMLEESEYVPASGWVRPRDLVPATDFPGRWSTVQMASHAARWTRREAENELSGGLWWRLDERPDGGWSGSVTTNGRHRAFVAAILDIPLVPTAGVRVVSHAAGPFLLPNTTPAITIDRPGMMGGLRQPQPALTWSEDSLGTVLWLAEAGLCARPDLSGFRGSGREALELRWVDRIFPWIVHETPEGVRGRLRAYEDRFGPAAQAQLLAA